MKLLISLAVMIFIYSGAALADEGSIKYEVWIDPLNPKAGVISADTSNLNTFKLLLPRLNPIAQDAAVVRVNCIKGNSSDEFIYGEPKLCDRIEWSVNFNNADSFKIDVSEQTNLYSAAGWWTLFEWNVLPRIEGVSKISICVPDIRANHSCWNLPNLDEAPLLMIWGDSRIDYQMEGLTFTIFTDNTGKRLFNRQTTKILEAQYNYLDGLLSPKNSSKIIRLVWVGIEKKWNKLGGAAGAESFISNYEVNRGKFDRRSKEKLLWISAHETFHMLIEYSYPIWISESLAHYYGYKSLALLGPTISNPAHEWTKSKFKIQFHAIGLYEAHQKVRQSNDMKYYGLFYDKGAAFWQELDNELLGKNDSLDRYFDLLEGSDDLSGSLDEDFVSAIENVIGAKTFAQLKAGYL